MKILLVLISLGLISPFFLNDTGCKEGPVFTWEAGHEGRDGTPQDGQLVDLMDSLSEGRGEVVTGEPGIKRSGQTQDDAAVDTPEDRQGAVAMKYDF